MPLNKDIADELKALGLPDDLSSPAVPEFVRATLGFNHPVFASAADRQAARDAFFISSVEIKEGVVKCIKCGSLKTFAVERQTRRCDEATTVFVQCTACRKKFKLN